MLVIVQVVSLQVSEISPYREGVAEFLLELICFL
jgi:hypothetical protein